MQDESNGSDSSNTQFADWDIPTSPKEGVLPRRISQCVQWENGVWWSWKFRSRGFQLFLKWVLNTIARRKLEPMDLRNEGFKVRGFIVFILIEKGITENKRWEKFYLTKKWEMPWDVALCPTLSTWKIIFIPGWRSSLPSAPSCQRQINTISKN